MRARTAALALAAAALLAAACGTTEKPGVAPSPPSTEATPGRPAVTDRATSTNDGAGCVVTLDPGADVGAAVASAEAGAVICLRAGRYEGALVVGRSVTLRGLGAPGEAVLDAAKGGPVVAVRDDDLEVRLEGLTGGPNGLAGVAKDFYAINPIPEGRYGFGSWKFNQNVLFAMIVGWTLVALASLLV